MKKITIAIDGFSSTGKSTLAKQLAHALGYIYVDTGAMYRAVTWYAVEHQLIDEHHFDIEKLIQQLPQISLWFHYNPALGFAEMFVNGENVEQEIRSLHISKFVSRIAEVSEIRKALVAQQQEFGQEKGVVMDGRDIGTVVFPNAELKFFMTASPEIRAERRFLELTNKGISTTLDEVLENVTQRDEIDSNRADSPLRKATDAIEIDNSDLSEKEQFEMVLELVNNKFKELEAKVL